MPKRRGNNKGFTLLELVIVVAVIAVLAGVFAPQYMQYIEKAKQANDLAVAANIIRAARVAIADPQNDIPQGHFVEVLWITGTESTGVTVGSLLVRHNDGYRVSVFNDKEGDDDLPPTSGDLNQLEPFADALFEVLGSADKRIQDDVRWLQCEFEDAESTLANQSNFSVHISTSTGRAALASGPNINPNHWYALGLDAEPHPKFPSDFD